VTINSIVTVSGSWNGPTVSIDATANFAINVGSVTFNAAQFPAGALVSDVNIAINFLKTDGTCASPATGSAFHNETNFRLQGPTGVQVVLAPPGTWSGGTVTPPVTVTFDQQAAAVPSGIPVSGSFLPTPDTLNTFNGTNPTGVWILQAGDSAGGDPLCVNNYTITVTAQ
jgi:hypothetical protein